jgi:hypothetical protein
MRDSFDLPELKAIVARLASLYPYDNHILSRPTPAEIIKYANKFIPKWQNLLVIDLLLSPRQSTGFHNLEGMLHNRFTNFWGGPRYRRHPLGPKQAILEDQELVALAKFFSSYPTDTLNLRSLKALYQTLNLTWQETPYNATPNAGYVYLARNDYFPNKIVKVGSSGSISGRDLDEYNLSKIYIPPVGVSYTTVESQVLKHFKSQTNLVNKSDRFEVTDIRVAMETFRQALEKHGYVDTRSSKSRCIVL